MTRATEARYAAVETTTRERLTEPLRYSAAAKAAFIEETWRLSEIADVEFTSAEACAEAIAATRVEVVYVPAAEREAVA